MSDDTIGLSLVINGQPIGPVSIPASLSMLEFLQEYLNMTGTRFGCGVAQCRACAVIIDNPDNTSETSVTCVVAAQEFEGKSIRTIEGHAKRGAQDEVQLSPVQQAFLDGFSFQCGYCTPGFVNTATVLYEQLHKTPIARSEVESYVVQGLNDHLCRCTGYVGYCEALKKLILETPGLTT